VVKGTTAGKLNHGSVVIQRGTTIGQIASNFYGANWILGMDLIKEYNPQIEDLDWVFAGEGLRIPPLATDTLLRKLPDNTYRLVLASFLSSIAASDFAHTVRKKGYQVMTTVRRVSDNLSLHRVEVAGLKNREEANQTWDSALANRWISLAESIR
jgi:hypothetical protein